jgi:predicted MFS family arabinose efflux permease
MGALQTPPRRVLPTIIFSQFAGSSVWFAGNAVMESLERELGGGANVAWLTSAVQLGFISGTLIMALSGLADRIAPRKLFLASCLAAALCNLAALATAAGVVVVLASRFAVGMCLAGVYPIGMKIAASWYRRGLGAAIGLLVGALVLGTAFPHLLRSLGARVDWRWVLVATSTCAALGGLSMILWVPPGPQLAAARRFEPRAVLQLFAEPRFRAAAFGYFGHMWELYTLWAFVPLALSRYARRQAPTLDVSAWSFAVIAVGFFGCALGGLWARRVGSARVAFVQLACSGACCLASPWLLAASPGVMLAFLLLWGVVVVGDSPQFSTLNALAAPPHLVGTGLTLVTSLGFGLTVASLALAQWIAVPTRLLPALAIGPLFGLWALRPLLRDDPSRAA